MKIVVLTHGGSYAKDILCELQARGLRVHAVLIPATQRDFKSQKRKLRRYSPRQIAHIAATRIIDHLDRSLRPERHMNPVDEYNGFAESVIQCGALNSDEMIDNLARLQPDLLLLAGCGIISSEIISIPTLSTINVHPGLLPWCRGVNVIEHSILRGVAVGVSAHIVDTGIDTGTILTRKLLPVQPYDSLASLQTLRHLMLQPIRQMDTNNPVNTGIANNSPTNSNMKFKNISDKDERLSYITSGNKLLTGTHSLTDWSKHLTPTSVLKLHFHRTLIEERDENIDSHCRRAEPKY